MSEQGPPGVLQATVPGDWPTVAAVVMEIAALLIGAHSDEPGPLEGRRLPEIKGQPSASNAYLVNVYISAPIDGGLSLREKADIPRDIRLGQVLINDLQGRTHIVALPSAPEYHPYWALVIERVQKVFQTVGYIHRRALKVTFSDLLDEYYARKERGERVRLKAMAEAAGVKYDSLRQAKVRYDRENGKM